VEQKAKIKKAKTMTKIEFLKLNHPRRWEVISLLTNMLWYCENCDILVDGGKRPTREIFPKAVRYCGNCDGTLTHRTGGGQTDPCYYYPLKKKPVKKKIKKS